MQAPHAIGHVRILLKSMEYEKRGERILKIREKRREEFKK